MALSIKPEEILKVRRSLDKKSLMKSAEVVVNVDVKNMADALLGSPEGHFDNRPSVLIHEVPAGTYTAMIFEYAVNGIWGLYDLDPIKLPFHHLAYTPSADWIAELMLCPYREKELKDVPAERMLNRFDTDRIRLKVLLETAEARSKLDYALHTPGSISQNDKAIFGIHSGEPDSVTLNYQDVSLLSGVSIGSLRNLSTGGNKVFTPIKAGRDAYLKPAEVDRWLRGRKDFKPTQVIKDRYWEIVLSNTEMTSPSNQFLEFPAE